MSRYQPRYKKFGRTFRKSFTKFIGFVRKNLIIFFINLLFFGIIIVWWWFGYKYWTDPKHDIKELVLRFDEIAELYDKTDIDTTIRDKFVWMNKLSYKGRSIIQKDITAEYHRVKESIMTLSGDILYVDIKWQLPNFVIIKDQLISNISINRIYTSTKDLSYYQWRPDASSKLVYIKSAWYNITWFDGVFYNIGINTFVKQLEIITSALSGYNTIAYMPGGKKAEIEMGNGQLLYFDLSKNTLEQIKKYQKLKNDYDNFYKYKIIDLGTIEDQVFLGN